MADLWTIRKLIEWMVGYFTDRAIDAPRLTAELLLSHVLQMKRIELYMHFEKPVEPDKLAALRDLVKRTSDHEPYAYLIGRTEFYSMEINVNRNCLIPRPETELLVERAIDFLRTRKASGTQKICDLCTGSGCIAVAIAKNFPDCKIIATDISDDALAVADTNIKKHHLENKIELLAGDLFEPVINGLDESKFDLIASNPPYISELEFEQLDKNVKDHEPRQALYGGADGFDIYRRIVASVPEHLKPDGVLMMEIGYLQGEGIRNLLEPVFAHIKIEKDVSDNDRVVIASSRPVENYRPDIFDRAVDTK